LADGSANKLSELDIPGLVGAVARTNKSYRQLLALTMITAVPEVLALLAIAQARTSSTILGEAEIIGGPTGANFDSPFHAFSVKRVDGSTRLVGYNNNGDSYRVLDGPSLTDRVPGPVNIVAVRRVLTSATFPFAALLYLHPCNHCLGTQGFHNNVIKVPRHLEATQGTCV
jgi:hypothetical protein